MVYRLLVFHLAMAVKLGAEPFATLAPSVHTHESGNVKTLLVCVIGDFLHDDFEVTWTTNGRDDSLDYITYSITKEEDGTHSTLSLLSVSSYELDLYSCIVRHRSTDVVIRKNYAEMADEDGKNSCCNKKWAITEDIKAQTQAANLLVVRLMLLKTIVFNVLMTVILLLEW